MATIFREKTRTEPAPPSDRLDAWSSSDKQTGCYAWLAPKSELTRPNRSLENRLTQLESPACTVIEDCSDWEETVSFRCTDYDAFAARERLFSEGFERVFSSLHRKGFYELEKRLRELSDPSEDDDPEQAPVALASLQKCAHFLSTLASALLNPRIGLGHDGVLGAAWVFDKTAVSVDFVYGEPVDFVCISRIVDERGEREILEGSEAPANAMRKIERFLNEHEQ